LPPSAWAVLDERARAAAIIGAENLYLYYDTGDPKFPRNIGQEYPYLFKTGDAFDVMLRAHGRWQELFPGANEERLLITRAPGADGKIATRATFYRLREIGADAAQKFRFTSPVGAVEFDRVEDVSAQIAAKRFGEGRVLITAPLELLGIDRNQTRLNLDLGILRGDGTQTVQRLYWNNPDTSIVSDIPSEARLTPAQWGLAVVRGRLPNVGEITLLPEAATFFGGGHALHTGHPESEIGWWSQGGAQWTFDVAPAGRYRVIVEQSVGDEGGDAFTVALRQPPNAAKDTAVLTAQTQSSGNWLKFIEVEAGEFELTAGAARLEIKPEGKLVGKEFMALARVRLIAAE
jgi:hypothetical protein